MIYVGIDRHKRYSHADLLDDSGAIPWEGRPDNDRSTLESLKAKSIDDTPVRSVIYHFGGGLEPRPFSRNRLQVK